VSVCNDSDQVILNLIVKKEKLSKSSRIRKKKKVSPEISVPSDQKSFDYGGLPQRDLKKNLGCG
jgi:hypothetical protein